MNELVLLAGIVLTSLGQEAHHEFDHPLRRGLALEDGQHTRDARKERFGKRAGVGLALQRAQPLRAPPVLGERLLGVVEDGLDLRLEWCGWWHGSPVYLISLNSQTSFFWTEV